MVNRVPGHCIPSSPLSVVLVPCRFFFSFHRPGAHLCVFRALFPIPGFLCSRRRSSLFSSARASFVFGGWFAPSSIFASPVFGCFTLCSLFVVFHRPCQPPAFSFYLIVLAPPLSVFSWLSPPCARASFLAAAAPSWSSSHFPFFSFRAAALPSFLLPVLLFFLLTASLCPPSSFHPSLAASLCAPYSVSCVVPAPPAFILFISLFGAPLSVFSWLSPSCPRASVLAPAAPP